MTPVTLWERQEKNERGELIWSFNHLEDDHCMNDKPTPKCDMHKKAWANGLWRGEHAFLTDATPPVVTHKSTS